MERLHKFSGRQRIKDRGIEWKEHYHEKSQRLKKRFDKQLGPSSYIRWEGHDYTTDSDYFIIMGPSLTKEGRKRFFAGIKKLPDDPKAKIYAPAGEYFTSSIAALSHASDKWAIPFPKGAPNYTESQLMGIEIPRHVKGENMKIIRTIKAQAQAQEQVQAQPAAPAAAPAPAQQMSPEIQPPAEDINLGYIRQFSTQLKKLSNSFASNIGSYQTDDEALTALEEIQTVVQKLIGSVQQGRRKNVITTPQAMQQAKIPLVDPRKQ